MNNRPQGIIQKFKSIDLGNLGISSITVSELLMVFVKVSIRNKIYNVWRNSFFHLKSSHMMKMRQNITEKFVHNLKNKEMLSAHLTY